MSRRKQAKPRAFLKLGETEGEEQPFPDLINPKEDLLSENAEHCLDDEFDDDEDECQPQQATAVAQNQEQTLLDVTELKLNARTSSNITTNHSAAATKSHINDNRNNNNIIASHRKDAIDSFSTTVAGDDAEIPTFGRQESEAAEDRVGGVGPAEHLIEFDIANLADANEDGVDGDNNEELAEIEEDYEEDEEEDEMDIHSLDSFYSDMYSTHTSSSYSPSISDGTMTPNSLHMHQHQHQFHHPHLPHHQQQQQLQQLQGMPHEDEGLGRTSHRLRLDNGEFGADDAEENVTDDGAEKKHADDTRLNGAATAALSATEQQQRNRLGRCHAAVKMPTKLRKVDREAAKFHKMTADGIKSSSAAADGSYQCQFCDKSFPRLGYLKKHEQSHAEHLPFKCDYCARLFKHKRSRDRHTKLHTGDRRYRCPHCEAAFSRSDHLKIHMKTHDNQKPFQCTICNRGYNTAAALTSHMQNHKKQAAILAAGGNPQALNYSPRSTGSASSNSSLHKRRYAIASAASDSSPSRLDYPKRLRSTYLTCTYCTKNDFMSLEQLNAHIQSMHDKELMAVAASASAGSDTQSFQLSCEYCTMKFPSIPTMFQHMRTTHVDRLTSPNSYFEHFNRLAATGTFSPRLLASSKTSLQRAGAASAEEHSIKLEQNPSPKSSQEAKEEEPTDLSQNKRRSQTPLSPPPHQQPMQHQSSPQTTENPGVFLCNQCNAGLPDFDSFRSHLKSHLAHGMNMVCHHCGLTLREPAEYERHVISHFLITNAEFNCTAANCQKSFGKADELQKHLQESHVATLYKCGLCSEIFETTVAVQVHFACEHSAETKILRCSACMEVFRSNQDFNVHVKTRHQVVNGSSSSLSSQSNSLQCMFCRTVCSSDLEMHFHLAAHARQFRCPSCPETFHVEFLLDRHMQTQHAGNEGACSALLPPNNIDPPAASGAISNGNHVNPMNSIYVNALFGKSPLVPLAAQNNNNNILDYNVAFAAQFNKGLFPNAAANAAAKFYSPLQVDTGGLKHPSLMYGLGQRYFDTNRTLIDMYNQHQQDKAAFPNASNFFISPKQTLQQPQQHQDQNTPSKAPSSPLGFSCGMCERNDFRTETDLLSHRKIVHNMKTGVSLRCAYCSGNFKSRSELEHHMKTCHNSTGKHKCLICDEIFPSPAILAEHKLQHSKVGQSGKCSHCAKPLLDVAAFKEHLPEHNAEGQMPVQCICCRQSLHSDFEVGLHAKFHMKSSGAPEAVCALCLESIPNAPKETKVCEKCCRKHNLNNKFNKQREAYERINTNAAAATGTGGDPSRSYIENRCNLCKMVLPHARKLQEHLVEHTFAGCEERGFICYICSAVFTASAGLLKHMTEHGANARPYDCNLCTEKYYFRAELDHHLIDHERRKTRPPNEGKMQTAEKRRDKSEEIRESMQNNAEVPIPAATAPTTVKKELREERNKHETGEEDDEYIEVEKVAELSHSRSSKQREEEAGQNAEHAQSMEKE